MSKKNFIDGMESIFTDSAENNIQEEANIFSYEAKSVRDPGEVFSSKKTSSSDPDEDYDYEEATSEKKKTHKKPLTGLDLLIRNTTGEGPSHHTGANQRKISFVFDKNLLSKLKAIASSEKTYFRELVTDVLKQFVAKYEKDNGKVDH